MADVPERPKPARLWTVVKRSSSDDPQGRPDWVAAKLAKVVGIICQLLHDLTCQDVVGQDEAGREVVRLAAMPKTAVVHAQGLAFVYRTKHGALFSVTREQVVLIGKSTQPDGSVVWSAPVFLRGRSWGVGLTGGFLTMRMCLAVMNDKGMAGVLRPHHNLGLNASFLVDMNGSRIRRLRTSSSGAPSQVLTDKEGGMMAKYYLLEAGLIDFSCRGGFFGPDDAMNEAIYGQGVDAREVLACRVQPPPEFQPIYNLLNEYMREVKAVHPRMTQAHDRSHAAGLNTLQLSRVSSLHDRSQGAALNTLAQPPNLSRNSSLQSSLPNRSAEDIAALSKGRPAGPGPAGAGGAGAAPRELSPTRLNRTSS